MATDIGICITLKASFEQAIEKATQAPKAEGFGVLSEIDVKSTMKKSWVCNSRHIESWAPATRLWLTVR